MQDSISGLAHHYRMRLAAQVRRPRVMQATTLTAALLAFLGLLAVPAVAFGQGQTSGGKITIGDDEPVVLSAPGGDKEVRAAAKIDTGASRSSIDTDLARQLGIDIENAEKVTIRSALGRERRPIVDITIRLAGKAIQTQATVSDRENLSSPVLIGKNDMGGFLVDPTRENLTTPYTAPTVSRLRSFFSLSPTPISTQALLAVIPLAGILVVAFRNLIGLQTFGLFAPILLAMAFVRTGLPTGLLVFGIMIVAGLVVEVALRPLSLPRVARMAALVAVVSTAMVLLDQFLNNHATHPTVITALPIVVTAVIIEHFWSIWEQEGLRPALVTTGWTLAVALVAGIVMLAGPVQSLAVSAPYALGILGAALSILIGRYRGLRVTEIVRFRPVAQRSQA